MSEAHMTLGAEQSVRPRGIRFIIAFIAGSVVWLAIFYGGLSALRSVDRLPPPPVSGTWCIDSRLAWMKEHPQWKEANLIAVGSSVTWRNLDFEVVSASNGSRLINAAPCFLTLNQTRYMTEYLVDRTPRLNTVMMVIAPRDLDGCSRNATAFFDRELVDQYLDGRASALWLRFRNFRAKDVLLHAWHADQRRPDMRYDRYGSGPLVRAEPDLGWPVQPESSCFPELARIAALLEARNIQFVVVTLPVMRGWSVRYDPEQASEHQFRAQVDAALASSKAIMVDGMTQWRLPTEAFADPAHLQWPETAAFTQFVWASAQKRGAQLPPLKSELQSKD